MFQQVPSSRSYPSCFICIKRSGADDLQLHDWLVMAETSGNQKKSRRGGYRRLLSQQFSFRREERDDAKAALESPRRSSSSATQGQEMKAHPVIKILEAPSKKAASKPEFLRYLDYMKEAGTWEASSDRPVIYFK